jgi:hypothetical protein
MNGGFAWLEVVWHALHQEAGERVTVRAKGS